MKQILLVIAALVVFAGMAFLAMPVVSNAAPASQPVAASVVQQATPVPQPTAQGGRRKRLEAPPMRPIAAGVLIGANALVAVAVVVFAWVLRRRRRPQ